MHINVRDFLAEDVGYNRTFAVTGERPHFESVKLTDDLEGELTISRLEEGLLVQGELKTAIELECHRCLRTFTRPVSIAFAQVYSLQPADDEIAFTGEEIDLAPLIEQEILVNLPIKLLCTPDCQGIEGVADQYKTEPAGTRLKDQARITKGPQRGRTEETNNPR